jgi:Zn-dependent membrane protease YugP
MAAGLTYVAAALTSLIQLLYWASMVFSHRD